MPKFQKHILPPCSGSITKLSAACTPETCAPSPTTTLRKNCIITISNNSSSRTHGLVAVRTAIVVVAVAIIPALVGPTEAVVITAAAYFRNDKKSSLFQL
jgi:hypothetical protein